MEQKAIFVTAYILSWFTQVMTPSLMPPARFQAFSTFLLQPGMGQITEFWGNDACALRPSHSEMTLGMGNPVSHVESWILV